MYAHVSTFWELNNHMIVGEMMINTHNMGSLDMCLVLGRTP